MMPFFLVQNKKINSYCLDKKTAKINTTAPLQVRKCCRLLHEKGALSWSSCQMQGSLSIEAALSLSLFLFFCFCLIMPMKMLDRQRQIQAVMESVGEELSQYAYVEYCFRTAEEGGAEVDVGRAEDTASSVLAAAYASARIMGEINREWVEAVSFEGTDIGEDEMVHIVMRYRMRLPFSVLGVSSIPVEQVCSRRMWNGADGERFGDGDRDGDGEEDEIVYIGKNSTRYHRLRTCHYLYNDLKAVDSGAVGELRNESGGRYSPCGTCGGGFGGTGSGGTGSGGTGSGGTGSGGTGSGSMGSSGMVYVMPYGSSYHVSKSCRSIIAYVQAVPLTQVEYLGECSYCRGK